VGFSVCLSLVTDDADHLIVASLPVLDKELFRSSFTHPVIELDAFLLLSFDTF
jgi:hypothetical protein